MTVRFDEELKKLLGKKTLEEINELSPSIYDISYLLKLTEYQEEALDYLKSTQLSDGSWGAVGDRMDNLTDRLVNTLAVVYNVVHSISSNDPLDSWLQRALSYINKGLQTWGQQNRSMIGSGLIIDYLSNKLSEKGLIQYNNTEASILAKKKMEYINKYGVVGTPVSFYAEVTSFIGDSNVFDERSIGILSSSAVISHLATGAIGPGETGTPVEIGTDEGTISPKAKKIFDKTYTKYGIKFPSFTSIDIYAAIWAARYLKMIGVYYTPIDWPKDKKLYSFSTWSDMKDADDTSVYYLNLPPGSEINEEVLDPFWCEKGGYYCAYPREINASLTVNAHCLELLRLINTMGIDHDVPRKIGLFESDLPPAEGRAGENATKRDLRVFGLENYLLKNQESDGKWIDKWHISPYYATCEIVLSLIDSENPQAHVAMNKAITWILTSQLPSGGWGTVGGDNGDLDRRSGDPKGTLEETGYSLIALVNYSNKFGIDAYTPILNGWTYINKEYSRLEYELDTYPLWIGKNLYTPKHIVRSVVLVASKLSESLLNSY